MAGFTPSVASVRNDYALCIRNAREALKDESLAWYEVTPASFGRVDAYNVQGAYAGLVKQIAAGKLALTVAKGKDENGTNLVAIARTK